MEKPNLKSKQSRLVVQHNLITSSRHNFTACQLDIFFMILTLINKDDAPDKEYSIYVKDIEAITGRKWNYKDVIDSTAQMGSKMFSIETKDGSIYIQMWLFQYVQYQKGKGYFNVCLSNIIRPYLFNLKGSFTVMELAGSLALDSKFSKRIYGLCCQWATVGEINYTIDELKEMLYLKDPAGIQKEQFCSISDFKRYVLDISKKQINEKTNIKLDYELIKKGRSFNSVKLLIGKQKIKQAVIDFGEDIEYQKKVATVVAYGLNEVYSKKIALKHYKDFLETITELNKLITAGKVDIKKQVPYLIGVCKKKGWIT